MELRQVILRQLKMKLKSPFTTSFGTLENKNFYLVEAVDENGTSGWGESVAFESPWYTEETVATNRYIMENFLIPLLFQDPIQHPDDVSERFAPVRRNNMAKAALEGAVWDLYAKRAGLQLAAALGGKKQKIDVGISIGIQSSIKKLLHLIEKYVDAGYKRIKVKIKPGWDLRVLQEIRRLFPDLPLMADANCAYTLNDIDHLKRFDDFGLMMIEQPLAHDDMVDHAQLQTHLSTAVCLDESIHSLADARQAVELGSCNIINIKSGRVGGLTEAKRIHDYCQQHGIKVWCGGMLESGVGRGHNIALSALPQFTLPGDIAGSSRYWEEDIVEPEVMVRDGIITIPDKPGIGYGVNSETVEKYTVDKKNVTANH